VSARIATDLVASADVIFVMDIYQVVEMRKRFPRDAARTFLLTCLWPEGPLEVRDPYDGDESVFEACFDDITRAVRPIVRIISEARRPGRRELA
jgi:protein-tyrosine-phosphatase